MNLSRRIAHNTFIQIVAKAISTALGLMAIAFITRYLGQNGFGEYTTVTTFALFFAILADFGLTLVTSQMISSFPEDRDKILSNLFLLRLVSAIVFTILAVGVVLFFPYSPLIKWGVVIISVSLVFTALNQILIGLFQKDLCMEKAAAGEIIGRIFLVVGVVFVIKINWGLLGILLISTLSTFLNFLANYLLSLKNSKIEFQYDKKIWLEILKKSWPLAITIALNLVYLKADTLILSLTKSQAEVGLYGAAYKVIDVFVTLPFIFAGLVLPVITVAWVNGDQERFKRIAQKAFDVMVILALPLIVGTQFVADRVIVFIAGNEFASSGQVLKILIIAAAAIFLGSIFSHGIIAIDKQKKTIWAYVFTSITALAGYFFFIPKYSYFGAAWVTVYSEVVIAFFSFFIMWRFTKFVPKFKNFFISLLACAVMALALHLLSFTNLFILLTSAVVVYSASLYLLGGLSFVSLKEILKKN